MGVNAPVIHQRIIARLTAKLYPLFESGTIHYEPLPEMMLGEYSTPTPDLVLYDNDADQTPVIIEICQTRGTKGDLQKVVQLIDGQLYGIHEGFVYDYKTQQWLRYRLGDGGVATTSSQSDVLQLDLNQFV
jgi:Uma2 family endonuclease